MNIGIYKLEIIKPTESQRERWMANARQVQQVTNLVWREWLTWHVQHGTAAEVRRLLRLKEETGAKEKWPLPMPKELSNKIYHAARELCPTLHTRTLVLTLNILGQKIATAKATNGNLRGWAAVLLDHQAIPSSTRPQPIPFDKANAKLIPPEKEGDNFRLQLRFCSTAAEEKIEDDVELLTSGPAWRYVKPMYDLLLGGKVFKGSSIVWDDKKRKWFAHVCYERITEPANVDENKTAVIRPGKLRPWLMRIDGRKETLRSYFDGRPVAPFRQRLRMERESRSSHYRFCGTNAKGHGRKRWLDTQKKLERKWVYFVKRVNDKMSRIIVDLAARNGCGKIVYIQPTIPRFLSEAGATERDSSGWQWYQLGTMLSYKANAMGIKVDVRKQKDRSTVPSVSKAANAQRKRRARPKKVRVS